MEFDIWNICGILTLCYGLAAAALFTLLQLGFIELCLAAILRRACRRLSTGPANQRNEALRITHDKHGVRISHCTLGQEALLRHSQGAFRIKALSVDFVSVELPSWRQPARIHVCGLKAELKQRQLPEHVAAKDRLRQQRESDQALKAAKLETVDRLLWQTDFMRQQASTSPSAGSAKRMLAKVQHRLLALATQAMDVSVEDVHISISQQDEPGPRLSPVSDLQGSDALRFSIRRLSLEPHGAQQQSHSSMRKGLRKHSPATWKDMLALPGRAARFAMVDAPFSSRLEVTGVSLSLVAHDDRQPDLPLRAAVPQSPTSGRSPERPPRTPPPGANAAVLGSQTGPFLVGLESSPGQKRRRARKGVAPLIPGEQAQPSVSAPKPAEEHVLIQQWGFEVILRIVPLGWHDSESTAPEKRRTSLETHSMYNNPLYTSEDTSASSLSDDAGEAQDGWQSRLPSVPEVVRDSYRKADERSIPNGLRSSVQGDVRSRSAFAPPGRPPGEKLNGRAGRGKSVSKEAESSMTGCRIEVSISLRAFVPTVSAASAAVAIRMAERWTRYEQYSPYWQVRPRMSVHSSPASWWQHAGHAALQECHVISRRQALFSGIVQRRADRQLYQALYARSAARFPSFHEPQLGWWSRRKVPKADKADEGELAALEDRLSLEEIAHFRAGVAATHSQNLTTSRAVTQHVMDAVDVIVGSPQALPKPLEAMLFQSNASGDPAGTLEMSLQIFCPKVGLQFSTGEEWMALTPRVPGSPFHLLEAAVRDVRLNLPAAGQASLSCASVAIGGLGALDEPLSAVVVQSPSAHCTRLLATADLHAAASRVQTKPAKTPGSFLVVKFGRGSANAENYAARQGGKASLLWEMLQPSGMEIDVEAAGIEVSHNTDAVVAGLSFLGQLDRIRDMPLAGSAPSSASAQSKPEPSLDARQPATLSERVKQAFAAHHLPIHNKKDIPFTTLKVACPGIVGVVQYHHTQISARKTPTKGSSGSEARSQYELVLAVSSIRVQMYGEDFQDFMHRGATQCSSFHAYMDLFCYQAPSSRKQEGWGLPQQLLSFRTVNARTSASILQRPSRDGEAAQEYADPQMQAMAQVWAHPEDLPLYPGPDEPFRLQSIRDRRPSSAFAGSDTGGPQRPSGTGRQHKEADPCPPFPLVPLLKVASAQAELSQKVLLVPAAPSSLNASLSLGAIGIMVAHVLSIVRTLQADLAPAWRPATARTKKQKRSRSKMSYLSSSHLHVACTLHVPLISSIIMVSKETHKGTTGRFKRWEWGKQIREGSPAYAWGRFITPLYGIKVVGFLAGMTYSGNGGLKAGVTMDGILARDLQLRPTSKFAYLLRPLPTRAAQLDAYAQFYRRRILRVVSVSKAAKRWLRACRAVVLKLRSKQRMFSGLARSFGTLQTGVKATSFLGSCVLGPQLSLAFSMDGLADQHHTHHPEPAHLQVEVGQLLTNLRVSSSNMLLPFTAQILQLLQDSPANVTTGASNEDEPVVPVKKDAAFPGLKIELGLVGLDLVLLVMGQELVSFKIVDAALTTEIASETACGGHPCGNSAVIVALTVEDMSLRDMQARPEHSMVLRPNSADGSCSLSLEYTQPHDQSVAPSLVIEMANPRILVLFRFLHDIAFGLSIVARGLRTNTDLLDEDGSAQPAPEPAPKKEQEISGSRQQPMQLLLHVSNLSVLLPASSKSRQVLECDAEVLMVGVPGLALPDSALATAMLPSVPDMVEASIANSRLARRVARPASPEKSSPHAPGAEEQQEAQANEEAVHSDEEKVEESDGVFTKAMKQFSNWEAREERKFHADLLQEQPGVLFVGDTYESPSPDRTSGVLQISEHSFPGRSRTPRQKRVPAFATSRKQDKKSIVLPLPSSVQNSAPDQLHGTISKGKEAADRGTISEEVHLPLRRSNSAPAELPEDSKAEGASPGSTEDEELMTEDVGVAVLADAFVVRCATIGATGLAPSRRRAKFTPSSVDVFAWPMDQYGLSDREAFIHQANYAIIMFEQQAASGDKYVQLHIEATDMAAVLNNGNYSALLGFVQGNLVEVSSFAQARPAPPVPEEPRTTFTADLNFDAPAGDRPNFYMTIAAPSLALVLEAEPQHWQSASSLPTASSSQLHPFARANFGSVNLNLATLQLSRSTYMSIAAASVECDDLRLAYSSVMNQIDIVPDGSMALNSSQSGNPILTNQAKSITSNSTASRGMQDSAIDFKTNGPLGRTTSYVPSLGGARAEGTGELLLERTKTLQRLGAEPGCGPIKFSRRQDAKKLQRSGQSLGVGFKSPLRQASDIRNMQKTGLSRGTSEASTGQYVPQLRQVRTRLESDSSTAQLTPVVEVCNVSELSEECQNGAPVIHLIRSPAVHPAKEAAHLQEEASQLPPGMTLEVSIALQKDGTVAVQTALDKALVQWPFLHDTSLIAAVTAVFLPAGHVTAGTDAAKAAAQAAAAGALDMTLLQPWLYNNVLLLNSQLFIPVLDKAANFDVVREKFGGSAALLGLHDRMADVLLTATALSAESPDTALCLEQRGLAATWSGLRVSYAAGGDGESDLRVDLRNFAAFVRDPMALVTCLLLPHSCSVKLQMQVAQAMAKAEYGKAVKAAIVIQRAFRRWRWEQMLSRRRNSRRRSSKAKEKWIQATAAEVLSRLGRPVVNEPPEENTMLDELVMVVASPRTKELLVDYAEHNKADDKAKVVAVNHAPTSVRLTLKLGSLTGRAAFSHVPFLHSILWMNEAILMAPTTAEMPATPMAVEIQDQGFRPSQLRVDAAIRTVSLVLCNDKLTTYGAPDVLQISVDQLDGHFYRNACFADRPPNQAGRVMMRLWASFLNNSSSRWEPIWENWPLHMEIMDIVSPIYRSDFQRRIWAGSEDRLNIQFNPAALLSLGDAHAFVEALLDIAPKAPGVPKGGPTPSTVSTNTKMAQLDSGPEMVEQMAQRGAITSRVPQKYLIQNNSGLSVYYWVDSGEAVQRTFHLESGESETLKAVPTRKVLSVSTFSKGGSVEKVGNVINLYFEGNWMPIKDVAVSVVGKYRYFMHSPAEHDSVPVIVDIILVGRTKIITLHSSVWLENLTDRRVAFRLHVPITPLVAPVAARPGAERQSELKSDSLLGPLPPGEGLYLPLTAVLGGLLFVRPEGYAEAQRDVIRLSADVELLREQQGFITCEPLDPTEGGPIEPLPLHCSLLVIPAQVNSEFQAFKHIDIRSRGEMARAMKPLEATLALQPTLILTNSLPCSLDVIVWQVAPFRKLRKEKSEQGKGKISDFIKYDIRQMHTAFTGTIPFSREEEDVLIGAMVPGRNRLPTEDDPEPEPVEVQMSRASLGQTGQHITLSLKPGASQNVYANMGGNVLVHVSAPALGLGAAHWAVVSWGESQVMRESITDAKYIYRLPKDVVLQGKTTWQARQPKASTVARYTAALKRAGAKFRAGIARSAGTGRDTPRTLGTPSSQLTAQRLGRTEQPGSAPGLRSAVREPEPGSSSDAIQGIVTGSRMLDTTSVLEEGDHTPLLSARDGFTTAFSSGRPRLMSVSEDVEAPATVSSDGDSESMHTAPASSLEPSSFKSLRSSPERKQGADAAESSHGRSAPTVSFDLMTGRRSIEGPSPSSGPNRTAAWVDSAAVSEEAEEGEDTDQDMLRAVFQAWRTAAANQHARRVHSNQNEVPLHERRSAPPLVLLGLDNSRARGRPQQPLTRVAFFSSYWIDNRTGMDLMFQDHAAAHRNPFLLGARLPGAYAEVLVPALPRAVTERGILETWDVQSAEEIPVAPILLNTQETTRFRLATGTRKKFSQTIHVNTVGSKGSVRIKQAAVVQLPSAMRGGLESLFRASQAFHPQSLKPGRLARITSLGRSSKPAVTVGLTPMGDGERIKLNIVPLTERPRSAGDTSAQVRASFQSAPTTPERPLRLLLDVDSTPTHSLATSPSAPFKEGMTVHRRGVTEDLEALESSQSRVLSDTPSGRGSGLFTQPQQQPSLLSSKRTWVVQKEYEFAVEVTAGPPTSVFCHTKVVTVKSRFIADNQTDMDIEIKQKGTPDIGISPAALEGRCAVRLKPRERAAIHWDDADLPREVVMRPVTSLGSDWHWSGSFKLSTREEYFGLRIRSKTQGRAINVPVNCTVGPSGTVLVTFKSHQSVPPYRIENQCSDVYIYFVQACLAGERPGRWNWLQPRPSGSSLAYAWDEPNEEHLLRVKARVKNKTGSLVSKEYSLDRLGAKQVMRLPTAKDLPGSSENLTQGSVPAELQEKVASLLASESSRKVYVTVFADGPTRVLRFADVQDQGAEEAEQSILDLAARLRQVEEQLWRINASFSALHGASGVRDLDLYGRANTVPGAQAGKSDGQPAVNVKSPSSSNTSSPNPRLKMKHKAVDLSPERTAGMSPVEENVVYSQSNSQGWGLSSFSVGEGTQLELGKITDVRLDPAGPSTVAQQGSSSSSEVEVVPPAQMLQLGRESMLDASAMPTDGRQRRYSDLGHLLPISGNSRNVQGTQLMRSAAQGDSALLLGGDLIVIVHQAEQLCGQERLTHPFARVRVGEQTQITNVLWQSINPDWGESLFFREICAASELVVEVWDVGGSKKSEQLQRLAEEPGRLVANSRFLGRVEVPLSETLSLKRDTRHWFTLRRRDATDNVSGRLQLEFAWDVTARSLLSLKLSALENVLCQRTEILCALNPVPASKAYKWIQTAPDSPKSAHPEASGANSHKGGQELLDDVQSQHYMEQQSATLMVTVLEACGMQPRKGVVVAFQANQLPNPLVEISVPGQPVYQVAAKHSLKPHFPTDHPARFERITQDAAVTVRLYDDKAGRRNQLLGEAVLPCKQIKGEDPVYVWLPLPAPPSIGPRLTKGPKERLPERASTSLFPELQLHMRLQWVRQVERGQIMHLDFSLEGCGISVVGGLQDELFNLTLDLVKMQAERTRAEAKLDGSIQRVQLDNQMLDATQPVVLAPASAAHAHVEAGVSRAVGQPLVRFGIVRSFANSLPGGPGESAGQPATPKAGGAASIMRREGDILSFRSLYLDIGEIDVQTDDGFLEAVLTFVVALPVADIWQDAAWREQQRRLLSAHFGPREVESLAMNAVLPLDRDEGCVAGAPLLWVQQREMKEMTVLRGQSAHSSWFFVETARIGDINANVTIALTSSILAARHGGVAPEISSGLFRRFIGTSGFQLINVNNMPLSLRGWSMDTRLIGRKALTNSLLRHYMGQAISEAHKVLGGAGPAIAAVPLTVVWAGGAFYTLASGLGAGKVGPRGAVQRVGYTFFMAIADVVGSFSRVGLSLYTYVPPNQTGTFSDSGALNRAVQRPANAFDAFRRAAEEGLSGLWSGISGTLMDPTQGFHTGGIPTAVLGVGKGVVGLALRPTFGILEMTSKASYGMGLVCLGREAISGSTLRRVRAPGALADDQNEATDFARSPELKASHERLLAAWQSALPLIFPALKESKVLEVMQAGDKRIVVLTETHVALMRVRVAAVRSVYRAMWKVRLTKIQTVRGDSDRLRIWIDFLREVHTFCAGTWMIPSRKRITCGTRAALETLVLKINQNIRSVSQGPMPEPDTGFSQFLPQELSIFG